MIHLSRRQSIPKTRSQLDERVAARGPPPVIPLSSRPAFAEPLVFRFSLPCGAAHFSQIRGFTSAEQVFLDGFGRGFDGVQPTETHIRIRSTTERVYSQPPGNLCEELRRRRLASLIE